MKAPKTCMEKCKFINLSLLVRLNIKNKSTFLFTLQKKIISIRIIHTKKVDLNGLWLRFFMYNIFGGFLIADFMLKAFCIYFFTFRWMQQLTISFLLWYQLLSFRDVFNTELIVLNIFRWMETIKRINGFMKYCGMFGWGAIFDCLNTLLFSWRNLLWE